MKTITMPTNIDPVKISINGVEYEYRAGESYEVPDDVASVIENVFANMPVESDNYSNDTVMDIGGRTLRNVANPVLAGDAVNRGYLDNRLTGKESLLNKLSSVSGQEKSTVKYPSMLAMTNYVESVIDKYIHFVLEDLPDLADIEISVDSDTVSITFKFIKNAFTFTLKNDTAWSVVSLSDGTNVYPISTINTTISQMEGFTFSLFNYITGNYANLEYQYHFDTDAHAEAAYEQLSGESDFFKEFTIKLDNAPTEEATLKTGE